MIIKQFAALAVLALALAGCATSLNNAAAGGATVAVVTGQGLDLLETRGWDDVASGVIEV